VITDVEGIRVGHWTDREGLTGCTVVLCPPGTAGSVDVKGGAPGTRETDALRPGTLTPEVHAVLLTGGSAFGLAAAGGVMSWLEERGVGFETAVARVPIVPAAVLFDLGLGDPAARPGPDAGWAACEAAAVDAVAEGSVGAGTGATVAKDPDPAAGWKGGVGTASLEEGDVVVGALAAVNALGAITEDDGTPIASNRHADPQIGGAFEPDDEPPRLPGTNTTLVVVATNARLSKERAQLLAQAGGEGLSLAVRPSHTMWDGDVVFALGTGAVDAGQPALERLAVQAVAVAIRRGVRLAEPLGGMPSVGVANA
jgi:L-aminopeptidase/D-esterase-like protein